MLFADWPKQHFLNSTSEWVYLSCSEHTSHTVSMPRVQWGHLAWGIFGLVSIFVYCLFGVSTLSNQRRYFISSRPINLQKKAKNFKILQNFKNFIYNLKIFQKISKFKKFHKNFLNSTNFKIYKISKLDKNYKTIVAYFVEYTVEKFEKFLVI